MNELRQKFDKTIDALKKNFSGVRTGRANPGLVENLMVDCYGAKMPLKQIATINVPENKTISITPFDRSNASSIEKAITTSDLNLNPKNEGHVIYIRLPELTADRRKELEKVVKNMSEETKIAVRNIRRDAIEDSKKSGQYSDDELKVHTERIQKTVDEYNAKIDDLLKHKETELREI